MQELAKQIRRDILRLCYQAKSGHIGGPLGSVEIYLALYFQIAKPEDKVVVSNGHYSALLYSVLNKKGLITDQELETFRKLGGLQGHPKRDNKKGIEISSGPVGEGLGQAVGMAQLKQGRVFCLMGDGEQAEGSVWESCLLANKLKLNNLIAIIDRNQCQIGGGTEDVLPLENLRSKYEAFGFEVREVDGHDIEKIVEAVQPSDRPLCVIAHTIFGKGVSYMEKNCQWHGKIPTVEQYEQALQEL